MTLKKFFESDKLMVIHCTTEEQAETLTLKFDKMGYSWRDGTSYFGETLFYDVEPGTICYSNTHGYATERWYREQGARVIEFEDIDDFK